MRLKIKHFIVLSLILFVSNVAMAENVVAYVCQGYTQYVANEGVDVTTMPKRTSLYGVSYGAGTDVVVSYVATSSSVAAGISDGELELPRNCSLAFTPAAGVEIKRIVLYYESITYTATNLTPSVGTITYDNHTFEWTGRVVGSAGDELTLKSNRGTKSVYLNYFEIYYDVVSVGDGPEITFTPATGSSLDTQSVIMCECSDSEAALHYTLDGSDPNASSSTFPATGLIPDLENGPITLRVAAVSGEDVLSQAEAHYALSEVRTIAGFIANADTENYVVIRNKLQVVMPQISGYYVGDATGILYVSDGTAYSDLSPLSQVENLPAKYFQKHSGGYTMDACYASAPIPVIEDEAADPYPAVTIGPSQIASHIGRYVQVNNFGLIKTASPQFPGIGSSEASIYMKNFTATTSLTGRRFNARGMVHLDSSPCLYPDFIEEIGTSDAIDIEADATEAGQIQIFDITGRRIQCALSDLPAGMYIIRTATSPRATLHLVR